jgi:hypothetical protein
MWREAGWGFRGPFLSEAAGSGSFESQGVFTIAGKAAIGKLSFFLLPCKSAWVLKVVYLTVHFPTQDKGCWLGGEVHRGARQRRVPGRLRRQGL